MHHLTHKKTDQSFFTFLIFFDFIGICFENLLYQIIQEILVITFDELKVGCYIFRILRYIPDPNRKYVLVNSRFWYFITVDELYEIE